MPYNLTPQEALPEMRKESAFLEFPILEGIDSETAFKLGFDTAVLHLQRLLEPDQLEVDAVSVVVVDDRAPLQDEETDAGWELG